MDTEFIQENLEYYEETQGVLPEKIKEFGEIYEEQGCFTREQLYRIAYESSTRSAYHVKKNSEDACREVTENLGRVEGDFSKIALVTALKGFKAPTASCVLTAIDHEKHAIVDTRVWAALERKGLVEGRRETFEAEHYVEMINHIREIAEETGFSTEKVGYALFAYDDKVREGTLH